MSRINGIQKAIQSLSGGEYQKFMDAYLYKKYNFTNIEPLGSHTGSNKVTKGIPDSYVKLDNNKYILIMYGTVKSASYKKIKKDVQSCLDKKNLDIKISQIKTIICCYTSTNIHLEQKQKLENMIKGIKISLIGIGTVSNDLLINYPYIASEFLNIPIDTEQVYTIDDFIEKYDKNGMNAPLNIELLHREDEINSIIKKLETSSIVMISGKSGIGKTRLALEVCRRYIAKHNVDIYCIKNNGQMLYNDLKYYLSDAGNYLLFIDDANQTTQLEHILDYINSPPAGINVKVILTVRDYAKDRIKKVIYNKTVPQEEIIKMLSDNNITDILNKNLEITNEVYLNQIRRIAKGNPRLAILAGKIAIQEGLQSIHNSTDIFKYYYGNIISKEFDDINKITVAFMIALFGPLQYSKDKIAIKLLGKRGITENEFYLLCHELNDSEIVDLYMDQAVKICDQSMGDYLLFYVLIEKKYIKIEDLLEYGFKYYKNKILHAINTIGKLFNTDECIKYIKDQVNNAWDKIKEDAIQLEYVKCFNMLNEEKSLAYIKNKIDILEAEQVLLYDFDFENINNRTIKCELINILGYFKYADNYDVALELAMYYFKKIPKKIMDFYFLFTERLGFDDYSHTQGYAKEKSIIDHLWQVSQKGKDVNSTLLLLNVIKHYLKFQFHITEISGKKSLSFKTINLCMCEGLSKLREKMWVILGNLYCNKKYKMIINKTLLDYNPYVKDNKHLIPIFQSDLNAIVEVILINKTNLDFNQSIVIKHLKKLCKRNETNYNIIDRYDLNKEFLIYNTFIDKEFGEDRHEKERLRKANIFDLVKDYNERDFVKLFNICNSDSCKKHRSKWALQQGLVFMFDSIKDNRNQYIIAIKKYLESNTPCSCWSRNMIKNLIKHIGIKETKRIICSYAFEEKNAWLYEFLFCIPKESIEKKNIDLLYQVFTEEIDKEKPIIPNIQELINFNDIDKNIICNLSKILLKQALDKPFIVSQFLGYDLNQKGCDIVYGIFKKNISILENLYLIDIENRTEYKSNLFVKLVQNNISFLKCFILTILAVDNNNLHGDYFHKLWEQDNYEQLIEIAFETIIDPTDPYWKCYNNMGIIFSNSENETELIESRKIKWIYNYIDNYFNNIKRLYVIFEIIGHVFNYIKKEFILYLLDKNKDVELFKNIPLFSRISTWNGSEILLIEKHINFLNKLIDSINGVDYIQHKAYLKEILTGKERHKQDILLKEYLENLDIS